VPRVHDRDMCGWRHLVENLLSGTGELRATATRHDRTDGSFTPSPVWWPRRDCQRALAWDTPEAHILPLDPADLTM